MNSNPLLKHLNKIIIVLISTLLVVMAFISPFDQKGKENVDSSFTQAMVVFGTAKALNGVISLAQGTEVGPPGVTVSIGEVLDPINDLVEQFSWIMLASMTSLGIQKILMNIVTGTLFDFLFVATLLILNIWLFYRFKNDNQTRDLFFKLAIVLVFLRFSIPMMAIINEYTYTNFVQQEYNIQELGDNITIISKNVRDINNESLPGSESYKAEQSQNNKSMWDLISSTYSEYTKIFQSEFYKKKIDRYQQAAEKASEHIIQLIIAFVFQTIFFPLIFLFLLYQLIRKVFAFGK
ncbi:MAG: hypothetical protein U9Q62_03820 [Campylobacterota bacterium]|nr:hypothetical protein [Campylobacterota bacterium]